MLVVNRMPNHIKEAILFHCTAVGKKEWVDRLLCELNEIAKAKNLKLVFTTDPSKQERSHFEKCLNR